ncbi:MAG: hypothetical protein AAGU11_00510 [Syntrophobacteraceae bacterium]
MNTILDVLFLSVLSFRLIRKVFGVVFSVGEPEQHPLFRPMMRGVGNPSTKDRAPFNIERGHNTFPPGFALFLEL